MLDLKAIFSDGLTAPPLPAHPVADAPEPAAVPVPPTSDATDLSTIPEAAVPGDVDQVTGEQRALFGDFPQLAGPYADWVMAPDTRGRIGLQATCAAVPFFAWEDLIDPDAPPSPPDPATAGPCPWCDRRAWWQSIYGATICGYCHPPAVSGLVAEQRGNRS